MPADSFGSLATLRPGDADYRIHRLDALERAGVGHVDRLPFSLKILLENLLRREDGRTVSAEDIRALASWAPRPVAEYRTHRLDALERAGVGHVDRLPFSLKILIENLLRREDGLAISAEDIRALASRRSRL